MLATSHKRTILNALRNIEQSTFSEDDIRTLLIHIRDLVSPQSFIKELAHFIAHPLRNKGLCYDELNMRALVLKQNFDDEKAMAPIKLLTINKDLYDIIYGIAIRKWQQREIKGKRIKKSSESSIRRRLNELYIFNKKDNLYTLNDLKELRWIWNIYHESTKALEVAPIANGSSIIEELNNEVKNVLKKYIHNTRYNNAIMSNKNDIIICLFILFQDSSFYIFGGEQGRFELILEKDADVDQAYIDACEDLDGGKKMIMSDFYLNQYKNSFIKLNGSFPLKKNFISSLFIESDIRLGDYADDDFFDTIVERYMIAISSHSATSEEDYNLLDDVQLKRNSDGKLRIYKDDFIF